MTKLEQVQKENALLLRRNRELVKILKDKIAILHLVEAKLNEAFTTDDNIMHYYDEQTINWLHGRIKMENKS